MTMTPEQFMAWVGGGTAVLAALMKGTAFVLEHFGLRPSDRRADRLLRRAETEVQIDRLKAEVLRCEERIEDLEEELRAERRNVDLLERMLTRQGWHKTENGWETQRGAPERRRPLRPPEEP